MNNKQLSVLITVLAGALAVSILHRMWNSWKNKKKEENDGNEESKHHHDHDRNRWWCIPVAHSFIIGQVSVNNNLITINGNIMSLSLVGKQTVSGVLIPLDQDGNPIDLTKFPVDSVIQPGSVQVSSGNLDLYNVVSDPANLPLGVITTSTGDIAGTATSTFLAKNSLGNFISGTEDVTVTLPETTTTTTQAPETAPVAMSFGVQWGTPTDVV